MTTIGVEMIHQEHEADIPYLHVRDNLHLLILLTLLTRALTSLLSTLVSSLTRLTSLLSTLISSLSRIKVLRTLRGRASRAP